jgi:hypothetical protein
MFISAALTPKVQRARFYIKPFSPAGAVGAICFGWMKLTKTRQFAKPIARITDNFSPRRCRRPRLHDAMVTTTLDLKYFHVVT